MLNGAEKVAAGMTTVEELLKVAPPLDQYSAIQSRSKLFFVNF
jgi:hypothetical protein